MTYFNASRRLPKDPDSLFLICQQDGKSLKDYLTGFKAAILEIHYLDEFVAMLAMKRGLWLFRFTFLLDKMFSKSYSELLKYIHMEEDTLSSEKSKKDPKISKPEKDQVGVRPRNMTLHIDEDLGRRI